MKRSKLIILLITVMAIVSVFVISKIMSNKQTADMSDLNEFEVKIETIEASISNSDFLKEDVVDDVNIKVASSNNSLPGNASLSVKNTEAKVVNEESIATYAYDIKILDNENNEIQPTGEVLISFGNMPEVSNTDLDVKVYHEDELIESIIKNNQVYVVTEGFSTYTVEFTYKEKQYILHGGDEAKLATVLAEVGIEGNIEDVEISNTELVSARVENGEWIVKSKKAFSTTEWMKVTVDGAKHTIVLTDAIQASGTFGTNLAWDITDGTLTIKPVAGKTTGSLPATNGKGWGANAPTDANLSQVFPWQTTTNRSFITSVVIEDGVTADVAQHELRYMFYNLTSLETVDMTKLDMTNVTVTNDMFRNCSALTAIEISNNFTPKQMNRMFKGCKNLATVQLGSETNPVDSITSGSLSNPTDIFDGCTALATLKLPGVDLSGASVQYMITSFRDRNDLMKTLELQGANIPNMGADSIFNFSNDTLQVLDLSRATVKQKMLRALFHNVNTSTYNITDYDACQNLQKVIMVGTNFVGTTTDNPPVMPFSMFRQLAGLVEVDLTDAKFTGAINFEQMFQDCTALQKVNMSGESLDVKSAQKMGKMFLNCTALTSLDVSGFGKLANILNMDDFVAGASALVILNLDNLDNSNIGPYNSRHSITNTFESGYTAQDVGASEFGREIFGKGKYDVASNFPALTTLSAQNSTIWMCKNNRGLPGNEYYLAENDNSILYFTNKNTEFKQGTNTATIDSKRDYIDLIIDRDGKHKHTLNPESTTLPDATTNINIIGRDLNKLGNDIFRPGKLAPGVYTIGTTQWAEDRIDASQSYYRISYIGEVPYIVEGVENHENLKMTTTGNNTFINTEVKTKAQWDQGVNTDGDYVIDCSGNKAIKITYEDAAIDVNGIKHDVVITINKITFKDLNLIPLAPDREHDGNKYINKNTAGAAGGYTPNIEGEYYRTILKASKIDGITFRNYVKVGDPTKFTNGQDTDHSYSAISGGSGTDIDFTVQIADVEDGKSFIFYVDDLDVAEQQNWNRPVANDACYDNLPIANGTYGIGGESFVLGSGNKLDTVTFADHTGLRLINGNTVVTTGSDPSTSWSEFTVKADPKGSNYIWSTGNACDSYALKNTLPPSNKLKITKVWEDRGATLSPRPDTLAVTVANYNGTIPTWTKGTDNKWTMIINDTEHTHNPGYTVTETPDDKYDSVVGTSTFTYNEDTGYFEAELKNKEKKVNITATKTWVDTDQQKDKRPAQIQLVLKTGTTEVARKTISSTDTGYTFTDLPKYDATRNEIVYIADEEVVNAGDLKFYEKSLSGLAVTNTFKVPDEKVNVPVEKEWVDTDEQKDKRPTQIKIQLLDGATVVKEQVIDENNKVGTDNNKWSYTFADLAKYDANGNVIAYSVDELEVNPEDLKFYSKKIQGTKITNTFTRPEDKIEITVNKSWVDTDKQSKRRPLSIKFVVMDKTNTVQEYVLKTENETAHTFTNLAKYDGNGDEITYSIDESEVNTGDLRFYTKTVGDVTDVVEGGSVVLNKKEATITNTYKDIPTKVVVKYIDADTDEELTETVEITGVVDQEYTTEEKTFNKYNLLKTEGTLSGEMGEETTYVYYYYSKIKSKVIVKYIDKETGKEISEEKTIIDELDKPYTTTKETISGYEFDSVKGNETGVITEDAIEVIYYYTKVKEEPVVQLPETGNNNPKTYDEGISKYVILMVMSLAGLVIVFKISKKNK